MIFNSAPVITQYFGENPNYYSKWGNFGHEGLDIVPSGQSHKVYSLLGGYAARVYESETYGNTVIVYDIVLKISIRYAHLEKVMVKQGEKMQRDHLIGIMGATPHGREGIWGKPMKPHLHINVIPMSLWNIKDFPENGFKGRVDPLGLLRFLGEI